MNKITALLPMKANSQRVPNKNFKLFNGKPLFMWVLNELLALELIDQIVINTDAKDNILDHGIHESERIIIRDRDSNLCGDEVSMNKIIKDDLENINSQIYLMTHTTNPLLTKFTINKAINTFLDCYDSRDSDSLFSVNKFQSRFYDRKCQPINHDPNNLIQTQELEPFFEENSILYLFTKESFNNTNARIGIRPIMFETPIIESIDIDTPSDWDFAFKLKQLMLKNNND
jgi:CMP-N-acetylneuraminic acid synthetase